MQASPSSTRRYCFRRSESSIMVPASRRESCQGKGLGVGRRSDLERVQDAGDNAVVADETGELNKPRHAVLALQPVEQGLDDVVGPQELPDVVDHVSLGGRQARELSTVAYGGDGGGAGARVLRRRRMRRPDVGAVLLARGGDDGQFPRIGPHL